MEKKCLKSWNEFKSQIIELNDFRKRLNREGSGHVSELLFRGQPDEELKLITTLERYLSKEQFAAREYFTSAKNVHPEIAAFAGIKWQVNKEIFEDWEEKFDPLFNRKFPAQDYMIYLRHHGFPSPLLDWTKSPYVAAYFAFNKVSKDIKRVAIFAYIDWAGKGKSQSGNNSVITEIDDRGPGHKRHYIQQSKYTICAKKSDRQVIFESHEKAFAKTEEGENLLWKFTLPVSNRIDALKDLDQMNVNSLSLFNTEDSMMETIALREFFLLKCDS